MIEMNFNDTRAVCEAIHGGDSFMLLAMQRDQDTRLVQLVQHSYATYDEQEPLFPDYVASGLEPYIMAGYSDGNGFANSNVMHSWAISVDFDNGLPDMIITNPLLGPSLLIRTSEGRFHCVWIIDRAPCSVDEMKLLTRAMAERLGGDASFAKPSQLIRLPGFVNKKYGTLVELMEQSNPTKAFDVDFLKDAFDVPLVANSMRGAHRRLNANLELKKTEVNEQELIEDLESAIPYLESYADDYDKWILILMALVPLGEKGRELAEQFSRLSPIYEQQEFDRKWQQIQNNPGQVATIFMIAMKNGWKNPGFRNVSSVDTQTLTDREFGRMIATKMRETHAVVERISGDKRKLVLCLWDKSAYRHLDLTACRNAIEKAGNEIVADLFERKAIDRDTLKKLKHKLGSHRSLDDVWEHAGEALIHESRGRLVGSYPYFSVENGVLNLLSQRLVPARYKPLARRGSQVVFDHAATAPLFEKAVREVFEYDEEMVTYFFRLLGYIMLGKPKEQIFLVFYGPSAGNGKSLLIDTLKAILGEYAAILPTVAIMTKSTVNESATPSTARLEGKRCALVSEPNKKHVIDSGMVKQMTGDRQMNVRGLYGDSKDIDIEFVLLLATNELPAIRDDDHGLWRRLRIVPFNRRFAEEEMDKSLGDKLKKESSGILNLMLAGLRDYLLNGMNEPPKVRVATGDKRKETDPMAAFLADATEPCEGNQVPLKALYGVHYKNWQKENAHFAPLTRPEFMKRLQAKGYHYITKSNLGYFVGLKSVAFEV